MLRKLLLAVAALALSLNGASQDASGTGWCGGDVCEEWAARYSGPGSGEDIATSVAVDGSGNVYVTGWSYGGEATQVDYATVKYDAAGVLQWVAEYNGPGNSDDYASALTVDNSGNVYVTGSSYGGADTEYDCAILKYSAAGVVQWVARYNGPGNGDDYCSKLAVDGAGNLYVAGTSAGEGTGSDYVTLKYDPTGVVQWEARYNSTGYEDDWAVDLAVDGSGNIYVTGSGWAPGLGADYATVKYNAGGIPQWVARYDSPGNSYDYADGLAVDGWGNVYVTGYSWWGEGSDSDYATLKYDGAGVLQWVAPYNGPGDSNDYAVDVVVDGPGNVYVGGRSFLSRAEWDCAIVKYSAAGVVQWVAPYNGPGSGDDFFNKLALDGAGDLYVAGQSVREGTDSDYVTLKYDPTGVVQWEARYNGTGNEDDVAVDLAVDGSGNVYVTGGSRGSATGFDYATMKYAQGPCPGDSDCDGLPDAYEQAHACLNPAAPDAGADPDGGGLTNLEEYHYGTDPCALPACQASPHNELNPCDMQRGDILLAHRLGVLYIAEEALFNGYWTHAGIYVGDGVVAESSGRIDCSPWWQVWTCLSPLPGVQTHRIQDSGFWAAPDWAVLRPAATTAQRDGASRYAINQTGRHYNWNYLDKETQDSFYCSQLVWRAYETQGIDLDSNLSALGAVLRWQGPWGIAEGAALLAAVPPDDIYFDADAAVIKQRPGVGAWVRRTLLRLLSPGDLYVTDPQGRHAGVDPVTGQVLDEIPGALYSGPDVEPQFVSIGHMSGPWQVEIVGNETGPYTLAGEQIDPESHSQTYAEGSLEAGALDSYVSTYGQTPTEGLHILGDSDGDGMADAYEAAHPCLDPAANDSAADPDNDGLSSLTEYRLYSTDPCQSDTDDDGMPDGYETAHTCLNPLVDDAAADPDNDGVDNLTEYNLGTGPCGVAPVGGIAELPALAGTSAEAARVSAERSSWSVGSYAALACGLAAAALATAAAGAWYARRRWVR
jgi:hypothetical protein